MPDFVDGQAVTYTDRQDVARHAPFQLFDYTNAAAGPGYYSDNPWYRITSLTQPIIQMELLRQWRRVSMWRPFAPFSVDISGSDSMTFTEIFDMEPNTDPLALRQIWLPSNYTDTRKQTIHFNKYGDKVALHDYDELVMSYKMDNVRGFRNIARNMLGQSVADFMDLKIRNAHLAGPRVLYAGDATSFADLDDADAQYLFDPAIAMDIWLRMGLEDIPLAINPTGNGVASMMIALTSPSVIFNIQANATDEYKQTLLYAQPTALLNYEVGSYKNVRYLASPRNILWNCGTVKTRAETQWDYGPGDGASSGLVDLVYTTGQASGVSNWIELDTLGVGADAIVVGDIVTVHRTVTDDYGVTDGVDFNEGTARQRRVVAVQANPPAIAFDKPLFSSFPAGSFVTKGVHIHVTVYIGGPRGVVNGVGQPITAFPIPPVDDLLEIWRFSWKGYFEMQLFRPNVFTLCFSTGSVPLIK